MIKENLTSGDVSDDFITYMKINREYGNVITVDHNNKKYREIDEELNILLKPGEVHNCITLYLLWFEEKPTVQIDVTIVRGEST